MCYGLESNSSMVEHQYMAMVLVMTVQLALVTLTVHNLTMMEEIALMAVQICSNAYNGYNPNANVHVQSSCGALKVYGCTNSNYTQSNSNTNWDDGTCTTLKVYGCTNSNYTQYNSNANWDNGYLYYFESIRMYKFKLFRI